MLNADRAPYFDSCPRCGEGGLQKFETHSYCVGCNYGESRGSDEILAIPFWALSYLKTAKAKSIIAEITKDRNRDDESIAI